MWRAIAGILMLLAGIGLAGSGFFYAWMSGFASPPNREFVVILGVTGMLAGIGAMAGGMLLLSRSRRRPP